MSNYRISDCLKKYLQANCLNISYCINGKMHSRHFEVKDAGDGIKNIGQVMTAALLTKALSGDMAAIKEVIDRVEGKATQPIAMSDAVDIKVGFEDV